RCPACVSERRGTAHSCLLAHSVKPQDWCREGTSSPIRLLRWLGNGFCQLGAQLVETLLALSISPLPAQIGVILGSKPAPDIHLFLILVDGGGWLTRAQEDAAEIGVIGSDVCKPERIERILLDELFPQCDRYAVLLHRLVEIASRLEDSAIAPMKISEI